MGGGGDGRAGAGRRPAPGRKPPPLARERGELEKRIRTLRGRLENKGYTDKAPRHLVQQTRDELAAAEAELAALGEPE